MKTPRFLLYRSGEKMDAALEDSGLSIGSSRLVGAFHFFGILAIVAGLAFILKLIAPTSNLSRYVQHHFDAILYVTVGLFIAYLLARGFWDSFWDNSGPAD